MKDKKHRLKRKADKMIQEWVRETYPSCLLCGARTQAGHHFFHKANCLALRYTKENIVPVCNHCHLLIHAQGDPYVGKIYKLKGQKWFDDLWEKRKQKVRDNLKFYQDAIENLKNPDDKSINFDIIQ